MTYAHKDKNDVIVIGAGIVGICCVLSLIEKGLSVVLIDRDEPGQGASYGNAGIISPWSIIPQSVPGIWKQIPGMLLNKHGPLSVNASYFPKLIPWGIKFLRNGNKQQVDKASTAMDLLNHSNIELYQKHLAGTGHENLIQDSMYVHAFRNPKDASLNDLGYKIRAEKGANLEKIDQQELQMLEPALSDTFKAAILIKGQARAMSPGKIATVLAQKAQNLGVEIIKANVENLSTSEINNWEVLTDLGKFNAKKIVLSAGAWSTQLLKPLGVSLPLVAERGYHLEYSNSEITLNNSVMDVDNMFVASSMENGLRIAGTAEFAELDAPPNEARIKSLKMHARIMLPDIKEDSVKTWMGARPSFPDSLPVLDEIKNHKGLFTAFGHAHYGLMMAPKTGQIIANLVTENTNNIDLSAFSAGRF